MCQWLRDYRCYSAPLQGVCKGNYFDHLVGIYCESYITIPTIGWSTKLNPFKTAKFSSDENRIPDSRANIGMVKVRRSSNSTVYITNHFTPHLPSSAAKYKILLRKFESLFDVEFESLTPDNVNLIIVVCEGKVKNSDIFNINCKISRWK